MSNNEYSFLEDGGEMGEIIRKTDWSQNAIGTPASWPQSLRTTLSILLNSRFPMFLFWGPQHICFYNDAYRPSLGNDGKHPDAIGKPGAEVWPEIWAFIKPLIDQVLSGGGATWNTDQLLPIYRNGRMEDVYWTFSYSPVKDESGKPGGVFVTCMETTDHVASLQQLADSRDAFEFAIESTELGAWDLNPLTNSFKANARFREWFGLPAEGEIQLPLSKSVVIASDKQRVDAAIATAMNYESGGIYNLEYTIVQPDTNKSRIVWAKGKVTFTEDKKPARFVGTLQDVTSQKRIESELAKNVALYRNLVVNNPVGTVLFLGEDMKIEVINTAMLRKWHKGASVMGKTLHEAMPEMQGQGLLESLQAVYHSGVSVENKESQTTVLVDDILQDFWFNISIHPLYDAHGAVYGVLKTASDITAVRKAQQKLKDSEQRFRSFIEKNPIATAVFTGKNLIIDVANDVMIGYWQKGNGVIGKPYREALPELHGQGFFEKLDELFQTGEEYHSYGQRADIMEKGQLKTYYFNYSFTPLFNEAGEVYAILNMGIDVTPQVLAKQKVDEAEANLRGAIELAQLATWSLNVKEGTVVYSTRFMDWLGFSEDTKSLDKAYDPLPGAFRQSVPAALDAAIAPGSSGFYDNEHPIVNRLTGQVRIIHAQAQVIYDADGHAVELRGTAQDITIQRELQLELENNVKQRTEELAIAIEKLQSTNEELATTNEELELSNRSLVYSNDQLSQYAYVASHDLQEPLRKISIFSTRLHEEEMLSEKNKGLLEKINGSAERMRLLISDLLDFSRLMKSDTPVHPVELSEVMQAVAVDFELSIQENNAVIRIHPLPCIEALRAQINQLFYNLMNNALKFSSKERKPEIVVQYTTLSPLQVSKYIHKPFAFATYYDITFSDNGIGFDSKHAEQIFEVFKRLHARQIYPGSGIGLALCRRIVNNLHGHMYAESEENKGSVFHIILPDRQQKS